MQRDFQMHACDARHSNNIIPGPPAGHRLWFHELQQGKWCFSEAKVLFSLVFWCFSFCLVLCMCATAQTTHIHQNHTTRAQTEHLWVSLHIHFRSFPARTAPWVISGSHFLAFWVRKWSFPGHFLTLWIHFLAKNELETIGNGCTATHRVVWDIFAGLESD